jgi:hypothetical protein
MNYSKIIVPLMFPLACLHAAHSASFQNLDFEATTLPVNGPGGLQPIEVALPAWDAFFSDGFHPPILYNDHFLGTAYVGLAGTAFTPLDGQFSVMLIPGAGSTGSAVSVSIAQTGLIPAGANTLQFLASAGAFHPTIRDFFGVFIDGQRLDVFPPFNQPGGITNTFSADISAYAGREVSLQFTSFQLGGYPNGLKLDNIMFINVPEPSVWALFGLGAVVLGWRIFRPRRQAD